MTRGVAARDNAGFTLVELLVAIVIEAIIIGALGMAFIGILKGSTSVNQSLSRSGDARIAAAYIISDARNSSGPDVSLTSFTCTDASPPASGGSLIVEFAFSTTSSTTGNTTPIVVDYFLGSNKLMRRECQNGALVSDNIVASNVSSVAVACSPAADCSGSPTTITVTITETGDTNGAAYVYTLTGTFRQAIGDGAPASAGTPQSIILLGSGTTCVSGATGLSMTTSAHITVYGTAVINNTDASGCKAMNMTTSSSFVAGSTQILSGGSCNATTSAVCPTTTSYSPSITDPYGSLAAPSASALGLTAQSGCSGGKAYPGVYASTLSVTTSSTCQLQPGVYILNAGISVTTSAQLTSAAGGVLLYIAGGSFTASTSATVNITAQTTNPWAGIAIWEAKTDTNTVSFSTSGNIVINGFIYAPKAAVNMSTSASNPTVTGIIAQNIIMTTSANLVIGVPPSITTTSLNNGEQSAAYSSTLTGTGGNTPYSWSATGLPAGLTINASTGVISGTPTATGTSSVVAKLTEATGATDTQSLSLTIVAAPTISTASPLAQGEKTATYSASVAGASGVTPYSWSATGLPAGLTMGSSGAITGTPTGTPGTATVAVSLSDAVGGVASKSLSLTVVAAPTITTSSLPSVEKTAPYTSTTMAGSGGTPGYTWTQTGLPAGLSMSTAGVISGNPTGTVGTSTVGVTLTDAAGGTATASLSLVVSAQPTITSVALTNKSGGTAGKLEAGDKITIVYGSAMKVSSFCSSWTSGDTNNQTLSGSGLMVSIPNSGSSNDVLSITNSSGCAFNLGTINLGSSGYVTANTTFGGTTNTTITWTAGTTKTLVITLGTLAGTVGTVSTNTSPIYTASSTLYDSAGAQLGNSPFTLTPAAVRF